MIVTVSNISRWRARIARHLGQLGQRLLRRYLLECFSKGGLMMNDFRWGWVEGPEKKKKGGGWRVIAFFMPSIILAVGIFIGLTLADLLRGL